MLWAIILIILGAYFNGSIWGMILFGIGMMALVVSVAKSVERVHPSVKPTEKVCPPHKWTYNEAGFLWCPLCKKHPGEITSDYDKPY